MLQNPHASPHPLTAILRTKPKLVGFLLHPVPRSETWRRLIFSSAADPPLAQGFGGSNNTGGRAELEENPGLDNP